MAQLPLSQKAKLEYFKDNIQTPEDQEEFDPAKYFYMREDPGQVNAHAIQEPMRGHGFPHGFGPMNVGGYNMHPNSQRPMATGLSRTSSGEIPQMDRLMSPLQGPMTSAYMPPQQALGAIGRTQPGGGASDQYMQPTLQRTASGGYGGVGGMSLQGGSIGMYPSGLGVSSSMMSQVAGPSATDGVQFDASDFPVLSATNPRENVRPAYPQAQAAVAGRQTQSEFLIQSEDFPALPGTEKTQNEEKVAPGKPERDVRTSKYGLLGLLDVIRMTDRDLNALALGSDLTTFGLNLNSSESLYSTFASPFSDTPTIKEVTPRFNIPQCYRIRNATGGPNLKTEHLNKFQLETLFYMFYNLPRDITQTAAALELYRRDWRWHTDLRIWLKPRGPQDPVLQASPSPAQYLYFDSVRFEVLLFGAQLPPRPAFATEEEIRNPLAAQHNQG